MNVNRTSATSPVITAAMTETRLQQDVTSTNLTILKLRALVRQEEQWYRDHDTNEQACFIALAKSISARIQPDDSIHIADDFSLIVRQYSEDDRLVLSLNGIEQQFEIHHSQLYPLLMLDQITHPEDYGLTKSEANSLLTDGVLQDAQLSNFDLSGVDLTGADLTGANLTGASLNGANLTGAHLTDASLDLANLTGAHLTKTSLDWANLTGAHLKGAYLIEASLNLANLTGADLTGAHLAKTDLNSVTLTRANLTRAHLAEAILPWANLTEADLTEATLDSVTLTGADLTEADLTGATLDSVTLTKANLTGAILTGTKIVLDLPTVWDEETLDYHLNHIHNNNKSLLMTIDSIDNSYLPLKRQLLAQLIKSLDKMPDKTALTPYVNNFLICLKTEYIDKASADPDYHADIETITKFMQDTVMSVVIQQANKGRWISNYSHIYPVLLSWITRDFQLEPSIKPEYQSAFERFIIENNLFFIQLIVNSQGHPDQSVCQQAHKLYERYLQLARIHPYTSEKLNAFGDLHGKADWEDKTANNIILVSNENDKTMLLSENQFKQMCEGAEKTAWEHFRLFQQDPEGNPMELFLDLNSALTGFPLFKGNYQAVLSRTTLPQLLALLNLGEEYTTLFREELKRDKRSTENRHKLIEFEQQHKLSACMTPLLIQDDAKTTLTYKHLVDIYNIYSHYSNNNTEKAQLLVSLAAVFVSFSSSDHFGTEADSPSALRQYAFALLQEAYQLDSSHTVITKEQFTDWSNRLFGNRGAFTCTAVLSDIIYRHATNTFPAVIHSIYPPSWK